MQTAQASDDLNIDNWVGELVARGANVCFTGTTRVAAIEYLEKILDNSFNEDKIITAVGIEPTPFKQSENILYIPKNIQQLDSSIISSFMRMNPDVIVLGGLSHQSTEFWGRIEENIKTRHNPYGKQFLVTVETETDTDRDKNLEQLAKAHFEIVVNINKRGKVRSIIQPNTSGVNRTLWTTDSVSGELKRVFGLSREVRRRLKIDKKPLGPKNNQAFREELCIPFPGFVKVGGVREENVGHVLFSGVAGSGKRIIPDSAYAKDLDEEQLRLFARDARIAFQDLHISAADREKANFVLDFLNRFNY